MGWDMGMMDEMMKIETRKLILLNFYEKLYILD